MLPVLAAVVAIAVAAILHVRAMRIRERIEAGTFAGLAEEIERLCDLAVIEVDDEEPMRLAA